MTNWEEHFSDSNECECHEPYCIHTENALRERIEILESEVEHLRAQPTAEQEREAIIKFLLILDNLPGSKNNPDLLPQIVNAIKLNDHWTGIAEETLKEYKKIQNE